MFLFCAKNISFGRDYIVPADYNVMCHSFFLQIHVIFILYSCVMILLLRCCISLFFCCQSLTIHFIVVVVVVVFNAFFFLLVSELNYLYRRLSFNFASVITQINVSGFIYLSKFCYLIFRINLYEQLTFQIISVYFRLYDINDCLYNLFSKAIKI